MEEIRLSVRTLTEFLLRSGSIDSRWGGMDRALEGGRIHRMLQKQAGPSYRPEVSLSLTVEFHGFLYKVEGRADGVAERDGGFWIDEIKTTGAPLELVTEEFNQAHWGQALCYAYLYARENSLPSMTVQLTYYQVDTEEIKRFQRERDFSQLEEFFFSLLESYEKWASWQQKWRETRDLSLKALPFPFEGYRPGQRKMAVAVYQTAALKGRLFCQAPTGIGKTISTLYPAAKALGEGKGERLFYLTAKTITRQAAEEAFAHLREKGMRLKTVTLTAKDKICFQEKRECSPDKCPYAEGYYDRINDTVYGILQQSDHMTREVLEQAARKNRVCPFELSLDLTLWCDGIVCDYNYLFDPVVSLKRFFGEKGGDYLFLVDEAHNLVDRARGIYSAECRLSTFASLEKKLKKQSGRLAGACARVDAVFQSLREGCEPGGCVVTEEPYPELTQAVRHMVTSSSLWLDDHKTDPLHDQVLQLYFDCSFYLRIADLYDEAFATLLAVDENGEDAWVKLLCLDPSALLDNTFKLGRAAVLFSATLSPPDYYASVLGGTENAKLCVLPSPYPQEQCCLLSVRGLSTKYADREKSLVPISEYLFAMCSARAGNYLVFFPSYQYMRAVSETFQKRYPEIPAVLQSPDWSEQQREEFLARFSCEEPPDGGTRDTLLGFCVLGGVFSEGIDLKGDRLIGAAVVGVGLPMLNPEQNIIRDYYNRKNGQGFSYAYQYPGMNKVLQAAGRVIRGEGDKGVILLIDSRFEKEEYSRLFPAHWSHRKSIRTPQEAAELLQAFWEA